MTVAEKRAVASRVKELVKKGVDEYIAKVMAKAELDTGIIRPVVYSND